MHKFNGLLVKPNPPYDKGVRFLDLIDMAIFDFIIGNADRHHYEVWADQPESMIILLDNAKSFGNPHHDELSILAPVAQCCLLRRSTFDRLVELKELVSLLPQSSNDNPKPKTAISAFWRQIERGYFLKRKPQKGRTNDEDADRSNSHGPYLAHFAQEAHRSDQSANADNLPNADKVCPGARARRCHRRELEAPGIVARATFLFIF